MRSPIENYGIPLPLLPPEALWSGSGTSACWKSLATALVWHSLGTTPGGTSGSTGVLALASWRRSARSMPTPQSKMLSLFMLFGLLGPIVSLASMPRWGPSSGIALNTGPWSFHSPPLVVLAPRILNSRVFSAAFSTWSNYVNSWASALS